MAEAQQKWKRSIIQNQSIEKHIQFIVIFFFVGVFTTAIFGSPTILSWGQISQIYVAFALLFSLFPKRILPAIYSVTKELKILLVLGALAPFFTGLFLAINYSIPKYESVEKYKVENYNVYHSDKQIEVFLENEKFKNQIEIRRFSSDQYPFSPDSAVYYIKTGIFGIKVVNDAQLIKKRS